MLSNPLCSKARESEQSSAIAPLRMVLDVFEASDRWMSFLPLKGVVPRPVEGIWSEAPRGWMPQANLIYVQVLVKMIEKTSISGVAKMVPLTNSAMSRYQ